MTPRSSRLIPSPIGPSNISTSDFLISDFSNTFLFQTTRPLAMAQKSICILSSGHFNIKQMTRYTSHSSTHWKDFHCLSRPLLNVTLMQPLFTFSLYNIPTQLICKPNLGWRDPYGHKYRGGALVQLWGCHEGLDNWLIQFIHALWSYLGLIPDIPFPFYSGLLLGSSDLRLGRFNNPPVLFTDLLQVPITMFGI